MLLLEEVFGLYEALCRGQRADDVLPPPPRPYADYIAFLQNQDLTAAETFWRQHLQGFRTPTLLSGGESVVVWTERQSENGEQSIQIAPPTTAALREFARRHELTLNTLIQGAWAVLLHRYSREEEVVFGATRTGRQTPLEGAGGMIGLFINTLPVRTRSSADMSLLPWLQELRNQWSGMRAYEHTSLLKIQEWSEVPRGNALFRSVVMFENAQLNTALSARGGRWQNCHFELLEQTDAPLTLASYGDEALVLKLEYDQSRFDTLAIGRMLGHLQTLLQSMLNSPHQRLVDLALLTHAEQQQLLVTWNAAQPDVFADAPDKTCIQTLFETQVERTPYALAVAYAEHADQQLTYFALNQRANQLAHHLRRLGVGPDVLVGICMERGLELAVGLLGILKVGGAYVPLDPAYPSERIAFMLEDAQLGVLLTQQRFAATLSGNDARLLCLDTDWERFAEEPDDNPPQVTTSEHLAYVIYTSGSTGKPKGVLVPHRGVVNHSLAVIQEYALRQEDRVLQSASISFNIAVEEIFPSWSVGAAVILRTPDMLGSVPDFFDVCDREQITVLNLPTAFWHELVYGLAESDTQLPARVRLVVVGGEKALDRPTRTGCDSAEIGCGG